MQTRKILVFLFVVLLVVPSVFALSVADIVGAVLSIFGVSVSSTTSAPSVSVNLSDDRVLVGETVTITGEASGDGLRSMDIYVNGSLVESFSCMVGSVAPEFCEKSISYTPTSAGTYSVRVVARDVSGSTGEATASFEAYTETCTCTPHVSLDVSPKEVTVGDSVHITVDGYVSYSEEYCDTEPAALRLRVYVDGTLVKSFDCGAPYGPECTKAPFSFDYQFSGVGDHEIYAVMVWDDCTGATRDDARSSTVTVTVNGKQPTVKIDSITPSSLCPYHFVRVDYTACYATNILFYVNDVLRGRADGDPNGCVSKYFTEYVDPDKYDYGETVDVKIVVNNSSGDTDSDSGSFTVKEEDECESDESADVIDADLLSETVEPTDMKIRVAFSAEYVNWVRVEVSVDGKWIPEFTVSDGSHYDEDPDYMEIANDGLEIALDGAEYTPGECYYVRVYGYNARNNTEDWEGAGFFCISGSQPVASISAPDRIASGEHFGVTVCGTDEDGEVVRAKLYAFGGIYEEDDLQNGCAYFVVSAPTVEQDTEYTLTAYVWDDDGIRSKPAEKSIVVYAESDKDEKPVVSWVSVDRLSDDEQRYRVRMRAEDHGDNAGICKAEFKIMNSEGRVVDSETKTYSDCPPVVEDSDGVVFDLCVPAGVYAAEVTVYDKSEQSATLSRNFEIPTTCIPPPPNKPPVITVFSVPEHPLPVGSNFNVYICASDSDGMVAKVGAKVDGGVWIYAALGQKSGCKSITLTAPSTPGKYTVYGVAIDNGGAKDTETNTIVVEKKNELPVVTTVNVSPNPAAAGSPIYVRVCGYDPDGTVVSVSAWINDGEKGTAPAENGCGTVELTAPSTPGRYIVYGTVTDDDGATAEEPKYTLLTVLPISHAPTVDKIGIEGTPFENDDFSIYAYVSDEDGDLARADLNILDVFGGSVGYWSVPVFGESDIATFGPIRLPAGEYNAVVTVFDRMGNRGMKTYAFTVVSNKPPVVRSAEVLSDVYVSSPFDVNVCAYDPDGNVEWITITVSPGGSATAQRVGGNGCHVITVPTPGDNVTPGDYNLVVEAIDYRGAKSNPYIVPITVLPPEVEDNIPPTIQVTAPETVAVGTDIVLHIVVTDNNAVDKVNVRTPTGVETYTPETNVFTLDYNYPAHEEGAYEFNIVAEDPAGNTSWKTVTVTATTEGHTYDLVLTASSGLVGKVVAEGKVDGSYTNISCDDVVVSVDKVESGSVLGSIEKQTIAIDGHTACQISITGAGTYKVTVSWMGDTESVFVKVFAKVAAAPENPVVAAVIGLVALAILAWLAH